MIEVAWRRFLVAAMACHATAFLLQSPSLALPHSSCRPHSPWARGFRVVSPGPDRRGRPSSVPVAPDAAAAEVPSSAALGAAGATVNLLAALPPPKLPGHPLALLVGSQFVLFLGVGAVIPVLPLYGQAIGLSAAANGVVVAAPAMALLLGARPSGALADKVGRTGAQHTILSPRTS